jgi:Bacterial PH domain
VGEELWRRSTRTSVGPSLMAWLAAIGAYLAFRSQWAWTRGALVAAVLLFGVGAIEAWRAEVVVGTEGIAVRRAYTRMRLPWANIADFAATARGRHAGVEVILAGGENRSLLDWGVEADRARDLVGELKAEFDRRRLGP